MIPMGQTRRKLGPVTAYAIAVKNGFVGTEAEWLESLRATDAQVAQYLIEHPEVLQQMNPVKGSVATLANLPGTAAVNDTYYVQSEKYRVTWTGTQWVQSSMSETDYEDELTALTGDTEKIKKQLSEISEAPHNLFDADVLLQASGWKKNGEDYSGVIKRLADTFGASGLPIYGAYEPGEQYTVSLAAFVDSELGENNGLTVFVKYTDASSPVALFGFPRNTTLLTRKSGTTARGRTVEFVSLSYANGASDTWHIQQMQIEKGDEATGYDPFSLQAKDPVARGLAALIPQIDDTLNQQGAAADAKAAGAAVSKLRGIVEMVSEPTNNLFDVDDLLLASGWQKNGEDYFGVVRRLTEAFGASGVPIRGAYEAGTQYTVSLSAFVGSELGTNNGLTVFVKYTDASSPVALFSFPRNTTNLTRKSGTTASGRSVEFISLSYSASGSDLWHIQQMQIEKGDTATGYAPYVQGLDPVARGAAQAIPALYQATENNAAAISGLTGGTIQYAGQLTSSTAPQSLGELLSGTLYAVSSSLGQSMSDWPFGSYPTGATILSFGWAKGTAGQALPSVQIAYPWYGFANTMAIRTKVSGSWTAWEYNDTKYKTSAAYANTNLKSTFNSILTYKGFLELGVGDYYLNGLDMPVGTTIRGVGNRTRIMFFGSTGYCIKLAGGCSVENLQIVGDPAFAPDGNLANKHGILMENADTTRQCYISNVTVSGFSGGGLTLRNNGTDIDRCVNVENSYFNKNNVGINIETKAEYNRFVNCLCTGNYYGAVNNGGNNTFANCGFDSNTVGMLMDNSNGQNTNNSHGSITGCTFNHSQNNTGYGLYAEAMLSGEMFTGCQFFYSKIGLTNSQGFVFNDCNFGSGSGIEINGGNTHLFSSCIVPNATYPTVTITNNTKTRFVNCYYRSGGTVFDPAPDETGPAVYAAQAVDAARTNSNTDGHLNEIPLVFSEEMRLYNPTTQKITETSVVSTDFIPVSGNLYYIVEPDEGVTTGSTYCYIQFYDENKEFYPGIWVARNKDGTPRANNKIWGDDSSNTHNRFSVPDGTFYVKVSQGNAGKVRLFQWDGSHFGFPVSASAGGPRASETGVEEIMLPSNGQITVTLPAKTEFVICQPGYHLLAIYGCSSAAAAPYYKETAIQPGSFPTELFAVPSGDRNKYFSYRAVLGELQDGTEEYAKVQFTGDADDIISAFTGESVETVSASARGALPITTGERRLSVARQINNISWICRRTRTASNSSEEESESPGDGKFTAGTRYNGIPYGSVWSAARVFGWHITSHTFLNAVNDPDSIFYTLSNNKGPGYSLVCSSYATLAGRFPYPQTNFGFLNDPNLQVQRVAVPEPGALVSNGTGHCVIADEIFRAVGRDYSVYNVLEGVHPITQRRSFPSGASARMAVAGIYSDYAAPMVFEINPLYFSPNIGIPYNISDTTIVGGSARPNRGDKSVYTSKIPVRINIKDDQATTLYYDICDSKTLVPTGAQQSLDIQSNLVEDDKLTGRQVEIPSGTLGNGNIYAVWTDADETKEYFEFYDVAGLSVTYEIDPDTGILRFHASDGNPWWYCTAALKTKIQGFYPPEKTQAGMMTICYSESGNYQGYLDKADFLRANVFFRKGQFGAYAL